MTLKTILLTNMIKKNDKIPYQPPEIARNKNRQINANEKIVSQPKSSSINLK